MNINKIEELIKADFLKRNNYKILPSYKTYKEAMKHEEKLSETLTNKQQYELFLFRDKFLQYYDEYLNEFADHLIECIKLLYHV